MGCGHHLETPPRSVDLRFISVCCILTQHVQVIGYSLNIFLYGILVVQICQYRVVLSYRRSVAHSVSPSHLFYKVH